MIRTADQDYVDVVAGVLAATGLIYLITLTFGFTFDDHLALPVPANVSTTGFPIYALTQWTFRAQAGQWPGAYHLVNVLLHALNGALLVALLTRWHASAAAALAAGTIFLLHPIQVDAIAHISARSDLLVALGWLVAALGLTLSAPRAVGPVLVGVAIMITAKPAGVLALLPLALVSGNPLTPDRSRYWLIGLAGCVGAPVVIGIGLAAWQSGWLAHAVVLGGWAPQAHAALQSVAVANWLVDVAVPWDLVVDRGWAQVSAVNVEVGGISLVLAGLLWAWCCRAVRVVGLWILACVGWRLVLPSGEWFGLPGDGYVVMIGLAIGLGAAVAAGWEWAGTREARS